MHQPHDIGTINLDPGYVFEIMSHAQGSVSNTCIPLFLYLAKMVGLGAIKSHQKEREETRKCSQWSEL